MSRCFAGANGKVTDSFTSIHDAPLHWSGRGHGKDGANDSGLPPENVLQEIDAQELNRMFVRRCISCASMLPHNCVMPALECLQAFWYLRRTVCRSKLDWTSTLGPWQRSDVLLSMRSGLLDSEAIVEFVRALCHVAQEELRPTAAPRVYSLTKIIEISHFNMSRIRYSSLSTHPH